MCDLSWAENKPAQSGQTSSQLLLESFILSSGQKEDSSAWLAEPQPFEEVSGCTKLASVPSFVLLWLLHAKWSTTPKQSVPIKSKQDKNMERNHPHVPINKDKTWPNSTLVHFFKEKGGRWCTLQSVGEQCFEAFTSVNVCLTTRVSCSVALHEERHNGFLINCRCCVTWEYV